jgi:two-component system KDP operon response regulator KdpE
VTAGRTRAALLVVEDDAATRRSLVAFLRGRGHHVREAADAGSALAAFEASRPDLLLLDLGLPDLDGATVVRRVRRDATTPIVIVSARDREEDKIAALEAGADDYVSKPVGMGELDARITAVLRRSAGPGADAGGVVTLGSLRLDPLRRSVEVAGRPVHLTPREYEVLKVLVAHAGRLVTHGRLLRAVWGTSYADEAHYIHVYVSQIRRKLAAADPDGSLRDLLVAEPGVGYRVVAPEAP